MKKLIFSFLIIIHLNVVAQNDGWNISTTESKNQTEAWVANG